MTQTEKIRQAATEYRKYGWNVIPLFGYSKNPASSSFIRKHGWKQFEERTLTEDEFQTAFGEKDLTGVGFITGALSRTVVLDEDSYKAGGKTVALYSPMISRTASGGRHIFGKYGSPVRSMGYRKGVNVEAKGDGGFIVLPPSQVYRKDKDGKATTEIGEYKWESHCAWEKLPVIEAEQMKPFIPENDGQRVKLREFVNAGVGDRHISLRTIALSLFNRFPQEEWDIAEESIRLEAQKQDPPPIDTHIDAIIRDAKNYVITHPKQRYVAAKTAAERTPEIDYQTMSDEVMDYIEKRAELSTGLGAIDEVLPYRAGFHVVVGNPGSGKGWYATWLAKQFFIRHQKKTVFFSLEMSEPLIRLRLLQQWSGLTEEQLEKGASTAAAKNLLKQGGLLIYPFGQNNAEYQTPDNFATDIDKFYEQGYRVFMFDHFHELDGANSDIATNQKVTQIWGKAFQEVCKKYVDIWLIIFAQPNGAAANKSFLTRTDISGSKGLTQKCEVFVSLNRQVMEKDFKIEEQQEQDRSVVFWVDKNRLSSSQKVGKMVFLSKTGNFTEYPDEDVLPDTAVMPQELTPREMAEQLELIEKKKEIVN